MIPVMTPVIPVMIPVMTPVIPVMIHVMIPVMTPVKPVMYSCYNHCVNCHECFHRIFTSAFRFYDYVIPVHTCSLPVFYPTCLLFLSDYIMSTSCLISFVICTLVLVLARHLAFAPLAWGVSFDSPGSSCPGLGAWSVWILPVADQSGAAVAWIPSRPSRAPSFQVPCSALEFSC